MTENKILTTQQIREALIDRRLYTVARQTGLSYPTLKKFLNDDTLNFNYKTLVILSKYLNKN